MIILFLGAPGAGKGTQANFFIKEGWVQLSTGDMFRALMKQDTPFALEVKEILASGQLVSDDITSKIAKPHIVKAIEDKKNIILDGYPRTLTQVKHLNEILKEAKSKLDLVVNFNIDEKLLIERLTKRRICPNCKATYHLVGMPPKKEGVCDKCQNNLVQRDDDKEDKIKVRMETYHELTKPLINVYKKDNNLIDVDGADAPEKVFKNIKGFINK